MVKSLLSSTVIREHSLFLSRVLFCYTKSNYSLFIDTLADKVGLRKGDRVVQINDTMTSNLNNEELRKLMRSRLQMNSINLRVLRKQKREKQEDHKTNGK